jgi:hypothetical protein
LAAYPQRCALRYSPRNLKGEAARVLPQAHLVRVPARLFPLSQGLQAARALPRAQPVPEAVRARLMAQRAAEVAEAEVAVAEVAVTPEVAGVAVETSRCSREPTSPKPCRASSRR